MKFVDYRIIHTDGSAREFDSITSAIVKDGLMHLYSQNGEGAPNEHVVSVSISGIRVYYTRDHFPNRVGPREAWPE